MTRSARVINYPQKLATDNNRESCFNQHKDFFSELINATDMQDRLKSRQDQCIAEINVLRSEARWQEIIDMFFPLEEKEPELVRMSMDVSIRKDLAFALGQLKRFEEAIAEYEKCLQSDSDNFYYNSGMAYTLYNYLFAANKKELILPYKRKKQILEMAHVYFKRVQKLRPHGVTNFYREGMLFKLIQHKIKQSMPLFLQAVRNWEDYDIDEKKKRHQEYKNYIKSLYNLASCQLKLNMPSDALKNMQKCIHHDEGKNYIKNEHKYFNLGKIHYALKNFKDARDALEFASSFVTPIEGDYILELLARVLMEQGKAEEALSLIHKIPVKKRRPFVRWTEADLLVRLNRISEAKKILIKTGEKDRRARHKAFNRLVKILFRENNYIEALEYAKKANEFHIKVYTTPDSDSLFWMAAVFLRLNKKEDAKRAIDDLAAFRPNYPLLPKLKSIYKHLT